MNSNLRPFTYAAVLAAPLLLSVPAQAGQDAHRTATVAQPKATQPSATKSKPNAKVDRSGRRQVGKASFYAPKFHGRTMADGTRMDPRDDNAASKTLPLGTKARVTNLETGRSAVVTIQDRGPYVPGRIVDLSPSTADKIGLTRKEGLADVEVTPLSLPEPAVAAGERDAH